MFGVVIRGTWTPKATNISNDVAVKLFIQSTNNFPEEEFLKMCCAAYDEIEVMRRAEKYIGSSEYIVKAHGLLMGALPPHLATKLDLRKEGLALSGVGLVMRNEGGGTLAGLVYNKKKNVIFPLHEKIRILSLIAKGLSELHSAGIVHAGKTVHCIHTHHPLDTYTSYSIYYIVFTCLTRTYPYPTLHRHQAGQHPAYQRHPQ